MDSISVKTTIIIKFAYYPTQFNNNIEEQQVMMGSEEFTSTGNSPATVNAAKSSCAVCGSRLHMTKHCPVHP